MYYGYVAVMKSSELCGEAPTSFHPMRLRRQIAHAVFAFRGAAAEPPQGAHEKESSLAQSFCREYGNVLRFLSRQTFLGAWAISGAEAARAKQAPRRTSQQRNVGKQIRCIPAR